MPEKTKAEIAYSTLEYTAIFRKPIVEAWGSSDYLLVAATLDALDPWGFKLEGVEYKTDTEKLSEQAIVFRRGVPAVPSQIVTLAPGKMSVTAENLDWTVAEQFIAGQRAARSAILQVGRAEIQSQHLLLGMHVQLTTKPRQEVTSPLLSHIAPQLLNGEITFPGVILNGEKSNIIIDASAAYANGLFIRIYREHPPEASLDRLAEVLQSDEKRVFDVLGLEGML